MYVSQDLTQSFRGYDKEALFLDQKLAPVNE